MRALGVYREPEYSPGRVEEDAAILDDVLRQLAPLSFDTLALSAPEFAAARAPAAELVLAMCQGESALRRLAEVERAGAVVINSALAIRNCYRDLLGLGLARARVPMPPGVLVSTTAPLERAALGGVDLSSGVYVKRGDLHALGPDDVQRVTSAGELDAVLRAFARRGISRAYLQQEVEGRTVKFYGVSATYFEVVSDGSEIGEGVIRALGQAASRGASELGLEVWGGDAMLSGDRFEIIDFNDWPSFSPVRAAAARAIARRAASMANRPR
jgi:hypothetical protein